MKGLQVGAVSVSDEFRGLQIGSVAMFAAAQMYLYGELSEVRQEVENAAETGRTSR